MLALFSPLSSLNFAISLAVLAVLSSGQCTLKDADLWKGELATKFTVSVVTVSKHHQVVPKLFAMRMSRSGESNALAMLIRKFTKHIAGMSRGCAQCFSQQVICGYKNCASVCLTRPTGAECLACVDRNCGDSFRACVGLDAANLPPAGIPDEAVVLLGAAEDTSSSEDAGAAEELPEGAAEEVPVGISTEAAVEPGAVDESTAASGEI